MLGSCADQVLANASQIASGAHADEHVHQLRVGLRRLRSALRLFADTPVDAALEPAAAALFRRLGTVRDQVVVQAEFAAGLAAALASAGVPGGVPGRVEGGSVEAVLRDPASQLFLFDLLAASQPGAEADADADAGSPPLRRALARRLDRWHRRAVADSQRYGDLDDAGRHRLRKDIKRLRYAVEFSASLFGRRRVKRYLRSLQAVQERLGAINDVGVAMQAFHALRDTDPRAWFALGWLAARRERLIGKIPPALREFSNSRRFWKGG